jgi:hypothetical protein
MVLRNQPVFAAPQNQSGQVLLKNLPGQGSIAAAVWEALAQTDPVALAQR